MDIFEVAARNKFRFPSNRGELTVENLFDLPLQSKSGFDLDSVAKAINSELKQTAEESFVETASPLNTELAQKLDIVVYVIKAKQAANAERLAAVNRKAEIEKLQNLLSRKEDAAIEALSADEIKARIAALMS